MPSDISASVARYYDLNPEAPADLVLYAALVPSPDASVLELGCGTGRVLLPLAERCGQIYGIDLSEEMLIICRAKLQQAGIAVTRAAVAAADICDFDLGRTFDLITAPYRVVQTLEDDSQLHGLFRCLHVHLSPRGTCVLNAFRLQREPETLRRNWVTEGETLRWEGMVGGDRLTCHERRPSIDADRVILYPELVWRRYGGDVLLDETVLRVPMRCYSPDQFIRLITQHGFRIINCWGGYAGEEYGVGPELVVQFESAV